LVCIERAVPKYVAHMPIPYGRYLVLDS
jgi:hypothetical protein